MSTEVVMPQMGESIAEGTITKWLKQVGDHVERDEPLFEISTDKVDAEIPSPAAGTLTEIRFKEGETVEVNTVVGVLDGDGTGATAPAAAPEEKAVASELPRPAPAPPPPTPPPPPPVVETAPMAPEPPSQKPAPPQETPKANVVTTVSGKDEDVEASAEDMRRAKSSPLVRKIAAEHGVDITKLEGTGLSGRVTKNDILSFIESGAAPSPAVKPS